MPAQPSRFKDATYLNNYKTNINQLKITKIETGPLMKILPKKSLLASALLLSMNIANVQAAEMCGEKTLPRQGEVPANEMHCITDYGHYLYVDVPYENSDVTITTSGGTFTGSDADITLYQGDYWDSAAIEATSDNPETNDESISFVSHAGKRYFAIGGNIQQTSLMVNISGGDIPPPPVPMGDYIVYPTSTFVEVPAALISSKAQYGASVAEILASDYNGFKAIAGAVIDPITDVSQALHYLAEADDLADPDLNQLLYFLAS